MRSSQAWASREERAIVEKPLARASSHSIIGVLRLSVNKCKYERTSKNAQSQKNTGRKKRKIIAIPPKNTNKYKSLCKIH
jgi:hypothetical protein